MSGTKVYKSKQCKICKEWIEPTEVLGKYYNEEHKHPICPNCKERDKIVIEEHSTLTGMTLVFLIMTSILYYAKEFLILSAGKEITYTLIIASLIALIGFGAITIIKQSKENKYWCRNCYSKITTNDYNATFKIKE